MPGVSQIVFAAKELDAQWVKGKRVLDVGACDFNGSVRPLIEAWKPSEYIGVDILSGPGVDIVCSADVLEEKFGPESFDLVICLEMLEHSRDWKRSISNMKRICKKGGKIILTTRSLGYPCHGFPDDYWRFEKEDMAQIFSDCELRALEKDPATPGIFVHVDKQESFKEAGLSALSVYSMLVNERKAHFEQSDFSHPYFARLKMKQKVRTFASESFLFCGRLVSRFLKI